MDEIFENEKYTVNVMVEYPNHDEFLPNGTEYKITMLEGNNLTTNTYGGDFVGRLIRNKLNELFELLIIIDNFGVVEVEMEPNTED